MPASSSLTLADRRMRDLLQSRRLEPSQDPNVSLGRARYAIVKHAVRARLAEREIKDLAADMLKLSLSAASGSLPRARDKEPRVRGMVDVNRAAMSVLEQRGLRYKQYSFKSASGWFTYRVHLLDPNAVTKLIVEDPALASVLSVPTTEQVRLQHEQAKAEGAQRKYGSVLSSDSYACEQAPRGKLLFSYDAFADGTSRRGAKHFPIIYYCNHLDVDVRFRAEAGGGAIVGGYAEIFRVPATDPRLQRMDPTERTKWEDAERQGHEQGVLNAVRNVFSAAEREGGALVKLPLASSAEQQRSVHAISAVTCWQLDHPQHMNYVAGLQCGYCDVCGRGIAGLADFCEACEERTTSRARQLHTRWTSAADGQARTAAASAMKAYGIRLSKNQLWDDKYIEGYKNVALSPLHVKKGVYADVWTWVM
jgi:hypothetical protein